MPAPLLRFTVLCSLLLLGACSRRETLVEAGTRTGVLHVGNGAEPESLDPHVLNAYTDQRLEAALFEGLCALDEKSSQPAPARPSAGRVPPTA
jgi:oligopeptide transport system substrate-binding protein